MIKIQLLKSMQLLCEKIETSNNFIERTSREFLILEDPQTSQGNKGKKNKTNVNLNYCVGTCLTN